MRPVNRLVCLLFTVLLCSPAHGQDTIGVWGMLKDTMTLNAAAVTAKSKEQKLREGAYAVNAINIKAMASSLNDISKAIDRSSGIRVRSEGGVGADTDLSINGMSGNSIRYFLDGVPMEAKGSGITLANIPVNIIESVEIYKGVIPASFGSDALGGAINIVTRKQHRNFLDFSYGIGSFATHRVNLYGQYSVPKTKIVVRPVFSLDYSKNNYKMRDVKVRSDDKTHYVITDCPRFHDEYRSLFGELEAGVVKTSWADEFFVTGSVSDVDKDIQTGATQSWVYGMVERKMQSENIAARYSKDGFISDNLSVLANLSYSWDHSRLIDTTYRKYYWDGTYIDGGHSEIRSRGKSIRHYKRPLLMARTNFVYKFNDAHSCSLNYMLNSIGNNQFDTFNEDFVPTDDKLIKHIISLSYNQSLFDGKMNNAFFFKDYVNHVVVGQTEQPYITGSGDVEPVSIRNYFGYGAGLRYVFAEAFSSKLSYEHSVRLPMSRELLGNGSTIYANFNLKPEQSHNITLGLFGAVDLGAGHLLSYETNGFLRLVDNYIQANISDQEGMMQYINVDAVHIKGVDGEVRYDWNGKLHLAANASYSDSRDKGQYKADGRPSVTYNNRTPNKPWTFCNAEAAYTFHNLFQEGSRLRLSCEYQWIHWFYLTWEAYGSPSTKPRIPTQNNVNMSLLYSWKNGRYNIHAECDNLLNQLAYDNYMLQKPGRAFFLKFRLFL